MRLNAKISFFFIGISVALITVLVAISLYAFRSFSISNATEHLRTAAEIVRVHLTESMINGTIDNRSQFLTRLTEVQGLKSAYVVRSELVNAQFGTQTKGEREPDELDQEALRSGVAQFHVLTSNDGDLVFRGTVPYIADSRGTPNCLQCHMAQSGDVLGAVTMTMSIAELRHNAITTVAGIAGTVTLFSLLMLWLLRRLLRPIHDTAEAVEQVVQQALDGNFRGQVQQQTNDEIGQIASDLNRLLSFLDNGLNRIGRQVAQLTGHKSKPNDNLLFATIDMVEGLVKASQFKQAIEEDETREEIYRRISNTLQNEFGLTEFSIYEVHNNRNRMHTVIVDGDEDNACRWCSTHILERAEACRARRTGHLVDGIVQEDICYGFKPAEDGKPRAYLCFPIMQAGTVGSIMQLVIHDEDKQRIQQSLPYINVFLREAAPVLEARRLMETLRESSLRDPMTGLKNRRFLEEYVETLVANTQRHQTHLAIMMLDLDYFKMVNDTYGHDAGDTVLKALAKVLRQSVRSSDLVIRYGGEEFMIVLQDAQREDADRIAENIRTRIEKMRIQVNGTVLQKTISIGIADYPTDSESFWQAIKFADVALYQAKANGRNRVVRFNSDMWHDSSEY
jgi:diguanylate cyclase (GGDEF)-like protein